MSSFIMIFIGDAIFDGTFLVFLFLLSTRFLKNGLNNIHQKVLIEAVNSVLLLGSVIYALTWLSELLIGFYSGAEYQQYAFVNRWFGPYWWAALALLIKSILLPQILWVKKFRKSLISTSIIISFWILINIVARLSAGSFNAFQELRKWGSYLTEFSIYAFLLTGTYYILKKRRSLA